MAKPFRRQIEEGILETAAGLFARHGFSQTSVQAVATEVGLSKAGLLHHFPTKDALGEAVAERSRALTREVVREVGDLAPGAERDRRSVELLADQAMASPGLVAYSLQATVSGFGALPAAEDGSIPVFEVFGVDPERDADRQVRVLGAMAALAMLSLVAHETGRTAAWRARIVDTAFDALGH